VNVVYSGSTLEITSPIVGLGLVVPVLNGEVLKDAAWNEVDGRRVDVALPRGGRLHFDILQGGETSRHIQYGISGLQDDFVLDSFGLAFIGLTNLRAFLRMGYYSWDGASYIEPETAPPHAVLQGYAMTQFLSRSHQGSVIVGFDRHDRFQHTFTIMGGGAPHTLIIETLWDRKAQDGECSSERLILFEAVDGDHEAGLREWSRIVGETMHARVSSPITGWCSWYNLYAYITEENILEHLRATAAVNQHEALGMQVFQIDDGFTPEMGDWLDVKPQFPRGIKPLLDDIRAAGFTPGLWIAPFMVGNRSKLYRDHPDWVVKDRETGAPLAHMKFYAEFRWHKRSEEYYILDTTHPDAFEYLRRVFHTWRYEWGCGYFKTDFMHFGSEYGADRAVWHTPGITRIEIWRRTAEMIRETIGDAIWLGCGCPLWASVGVVDAIRIGRDVGVEWRGDYSAQSLLRDGMMRNFASGILWQADPDCLLLRERFHNLTDAEVQSLAIYAGMAGSVITTSDNLAEVSPGRLNLWKLLVTSAGSSLCHFPSMGQSDLLYGTDTRGRSEGRAVDPVIVQVRKTPELSAIFVLNGGENAVERVYPLERFGLKGAQFAYNWTTDHAYPESIDKITVTLRPHEGTLFFLSQHAFTAPPERLP
jgi:alpha-galactosidase